MVTHITSQRVIWKGNGLGIVQKVPVFSLSFAGEKSDIFWKDQTSVRSVTSDGGEVLFLGFSEGVVTLYVHYSEYDLFELWTFNLEKKRNVLFHSPYWRLGSKGRFVQGFL